MGMETGTFGHEYEMHDAQREVGVVAPPKIAGSTPLWQRWLQALLHTREISPYRLLPSDWLHIIAMFLLTRISIVVIGLIGLIGIWHRDVSSGHRGAHICAHPPLARQLATPLRAF